MASRGFYDEFTLITDKNKVEALYIALTALSLVYEDGWIMFWILELNVFN